MALFKCKMCGGSLDINENESYTTCEYCGTKQTLPKLDNDERANLYDRANHFRRNNEYDKASAIYEKILNQDSTDSEAYWSLVLCRYGIEYVEDPQTHKRIPTVNRAQFTSIYSDENYKSALQYADSYQKELYEAEAKNIDEIQKNILSISQKESPFDVFVCYKETDEQGRRTIDSVLANDLYHQLSQEGFKVFYSRITLEEKLGSAYEPYIFAALHSAKIMVVLGTKPEYFKAVWVKNEWSRYLGLIKSGSKKMLIPAYKGMDPYDLPEEFSHLQAQDMSKLGFMQDLIRGIKKIIDVNKPKSEKERVITDNINININPLLKRAKIFLEDKNWNDANTYTEKVLDLDPENATAYLYKMMAELKVALFEDLAKLEEPFDDNSNYQKTLRFGDEKLVNTLKGYIETINERKEQNRLEAIYNNANDYMTKKDYVTAANVFESIIDFKDSKELKAKCIKIQEEIRKNKIYESANVDFQSNKISILENAKKQFESISGWKDSDELAQACQVKIEEMKAKEEQEKIDRERRAEERRIAAIARNKKNKKIAKIVIPSISIVITFLILLFSVYIPNTKYNQAVELMESGSYEEASVIFKELGSYKDSESKLNELIYQHPYLRYFIAEIGDVIIFGSYEQDNNIANGKEAIEWIVLDKKDGQLLVISKYILDQQQYHGTYTSITWENSSIRSWLNSTFINSAFSTEEREMIPSILVINDDNPTYGTNGGNNTTDRIFLLSIEEANNYFLSDSARAVKATAYAVSQGVYVNSENGNSFWWLRSSGYDSDVAAYVYTYGNVSASGSSVNYNYSGVRPALWIDFSNLESTNP